MLERRTGGEAIQSHGNDFHFTLNAMQTQRKAFKKRINGSEWDFGKYEQKEDWRVVKSKAAKVGRRLQGTGQG